MTSTCAGTLRRPSTPPHRPRSAARRGGVALRGLLDPLLLLLFRSLWLSLLCVVPAAITAAIVVGVMRFVII